MYLKVHEKLVKLVVEIGILIFKDNIVAFASRLSLLFWYHKVCLYAVRCVKVSVMLVNFVGSLEYLRILRCIRADYGVKRFSSLFQERL
jgi:hypothetical protein